MYFSPQRVMQTASNPSQANRMLDARNANSVVKWRELCSINDAFISFAKLGLKMLHKSSVSFYFLSLFVVNLLCLLFINFLL